MANRLGIGIIGAGDISRSHLLAFRSRANRDLARVVGIADVDEARAGAQAATFEIGRTYTSLEQALSDPEVDAVCICTPPFLHVNQSIAALRAGKHVLCEKPVSPTLVGLDAIGDAQREGGTVFSGVFQYRMGQGAQQVKALIDAGRFGHLRFGLSETLWQRPQSYYDVWWRGTWDKESGGVSMGHGIHGIDTLMWLMGEPASLVADAATVKLNIDVEDTSAAIVRFRSGAMAQIAVTVNAQDNRSRLEIFGDGLQAVAAPSPYGLTNGPFRLTSVDPNVAERAKDEATQLVPDETKYLHVSAVHDFLEAIVEKRAPLVTVAECRRSLEIITGIYKSSMTGTRVEFPITSDDPFYRRIPPDGLGLVALEGIS
ncbi:MAG: Gfo/Idh/MocA family oxidoreductase [Chloroflexota bacterium]|nr:Gfo/Idh/MocA family oxidoreductase [Chloroflexota bacterium]